MKDEIIEEIEKNMTPRLIKDLGMKYPAENSKVVRRFGLYECQYCGKEFEAQTPNIRNGHTKSCGCYLKKINKEMFSVHNLRGHRLYNMWNAMVQRCYNENYIAYKYYGERGISVCERWHSVENFIEDMFPSFEEELTLDRIDVNGNYEPDNCRWAIRTIQSRNTRKIKSTNTSGFRGVSWDTSRNKYAVQITINYKKMYLGRFISPEQGALVYDTYVRENNLEHTKNFSDEEYYELVEKYKGEFNEKYL